jgi:nicotinate phosphoribosyltransferase
MGFIADTYDVDQTTPLLTDKYHFTTAYGYWLEGRADNPSTFYMFGRKEAAGAGYSIAGGLEGLIDIVQRWQVYGFTEDDLNFLRSQKRPSGKPVFPEAFIQYLSEMEFKLKIEALPEGEVFFPQEPVLRVSGPIAQVKMLESVALGLINGHSGYMTQGAHQASVVEEELENGSPRGQASAQGMRRGPGLGAMLESSRSLGAGGYKSSSTGTAAKMFAQPFAGTMDHAWVMTHGAEIGKVPMAELFRLSDEDKVRELRWALKEDAFRSFAFAHPESGILLVDTYDPLQGMENAIQVIKELHAQGLGANYGIRFDSGDIVEYSKIALRRFAEEGFIEGIDPAKVSGMSHEQLLKHAEKSKVFVSAADGIDEYSAQEMRAAGAFFKSWGIGTAGSHVPPLGLVYKASSVYMDVLDGEDVPAEIKKTPVMKVASNAPVKSSNPGAINSRRFYDANGKLSHVVVYDQTLGLYPAGEMINLRDFKDVKKSPRNLISRDSLVPVFDENGQLILPAPAQKETHPGSGKFTTDLAALEKRIKSQLDTLPDNVRQVRRPRAEVLKEKLVAAFNAAKKAGQSLLNLDIAAIEKSLPPEPGRIPVYLDRKLFDQRAAVEQRHLGHISSEAGVGEYKERFNGGNNTPTGLKQ